MKSTLLTAAGLAALLLPGVARADEAELRAELDNLQSRIDGLESKLERSERPTYPSPEFTRRLHNDLEAYQQMMRNQPRR